MFRYWIMPILLLTAAPAAAGPADDGRWYTGAYAFSDELGGFRILSASGTGTRADPITIVQELVSADPAALTIYAALPINPTGKLGEWVTGMMHLRVVTVNRSGLPWIGFAFELQEIRGEPSTFHDGLSFDQRQTHSENVGVRPFASVERHFEPYDRLEFTDGHVDPNEDASFRFFISDFTPVQQFYLLQDPQIPFS